ncbi:amidohydrolase [Aestuariimicrobium sp. T2.26MG-19.2B]|uniref:amidohydrolase n=1 Tax=Aestuariimicrobium sp. T2.26MG-19.2B TaxID=3040679 RepID=UPI002477A2C3|nr:amidohydrolase [Aestuariimicrobium sp. T2.26MG-19.2B]CAI9399003.1 Imidazolonepropionase [Aestuariimicrobium sp. T2.26MG-19.2B]
MSVIAITNAHVVPVVGEPFDGTVIVENGKISASGTDVQVPEGAEVVDAGGRWLLPGLVEAHGHVGIHEEGIGWAGNDTNEGTEVNGARFRALDAIHPSDEGFRDALSGGVTSMVVKPGSANPIGGQTVAIKCWGRMVDEMVFKQPVSVKSALGENPKRFHGQERKVLPTTRQGVAAVLREAFTKAQDYSARKKHAESEGKPFDRDLTFETLVQVLENGLPWCQHTHRVDDIATAIRLADEFGYKLVINHGTEAHLLADLIAERNLPVVIGPLMTSRSKWEVNQRSLANPGHLARAGVQIAITTDAPVIPINFLIYQVILAVKEGLDRRTGIESVTINPARILGLDDRVGSIETGKDADLALWSGDPLDIYSRVETVWVDGRQVYTWDDETAEGVTLDPYSTLGSTVKPPQRGRR